MTVVRTPDGFNVDAEATPYVFGRGTRYSFQDPQAAIDAAVGDGAGPNGNVAVVVGAPGTYEADVQMRSGVILRGLAAAATTIIGTVSYDGDAAIPVGDRATAIRTLTVQAPAGAPALRFTGANLQFLTAVECQIRASDSTAIVMDNTGVVGPDSSLLGLAQCLAGADGALGVPLIDQSAGMFVAAQSQLEADDTDVCLAATGGTTIVFVSSLQGELSVTGGGFGFLRRPTISALGRPALTSGTFVVALQGILDTDVTPVVVGAGVLAFDLLSFQGGAAVLDPALTLMQIPVARAAALQYTPAVLVDWGGTPPASTADALDRIAAAVGPIP